jgi:hypothetical protein
MSFREGLIVFSPCSRIPFSRPLSFNDNVTCTPFVSLILVFLPDAQAI